MIRASTRAQRRPESELRRHETVGNIVGAVFRAQRRPESELRRHGRASRRPRRPGSSLNEGRSLNSGDTRRRPRAAGRPASTLNEGRSLNSGDTRIAPEPFTGRWQRSTKAGV